LECQTQDVLTFNIKKTVTGPVFETQKKLLTKRGFGPFLVLTHSGVDATTLV